MRDLAYHTVQGIYRIAPGLVYRPASIPFLCNSRIPPFQRSLARYSSLDPNHLMNARAAPSVHTYVASVGS